MADPGTDEDVRAALDREVRMVADRFRTMSEGKLAGASARYASRAAAGQRAAQLLADAGIGIAHRDDETPPVWPEVPPLSPFAVGDQVAVTGQDLLDVAAGIPDDTPAWTRDGRRPTVEVLAAAVETLSELRLGL